MLSGTIFLSTSQDCLLFISPSSCWPMLLLWWITSHGHALLSNVAPLFSLHLMDKYHKLLIFASVASNFLWSQNKQLWMRNILYSLFLFWLVTYISRISCEIWGIGNNINFNEYQMSLPCRYLTIWVCRGYASLSMCCVITLSSFSTIFTTETL